MGRGLLYLLAIVLGLSSGCSTFESKMEPMSTFDKGLGLMASGEAFQAQKLWQLVCADEHDLSCWAQGKFYSPKSRWPILQGATDESSTQIVVQVKKGENPRIYLRDMKYGKVFQGAQRKEASRSHSQWSVIQVLFKNLNPDTSYQLLVAGEGGEIFDIRNLKTLSVGKNKLRFAIVSCMSDRLEKVQVEQWNNLADLKPEVLFLIGDATYIDLEGNRLTRKITPSRIWNRHAETREKLQIFKRHQLIPTFATWDDHDYGLNNAGSEFTHKAVAKKVFNTFFPQDTNGVVFDKGPGLSQALRLRGQTFVFFDNRTFRSSPKVKTNQSHFGKEQEKWMFEVFKKYPGPIWLVSGDQFFGGYHPYESYQGNHPVAFEKFLRKLRKSRRRFVFVSGDRHLTEIMKLPLRATGFQTYELTSSGIHSTTYPGSFKKYPNPLDIEAKDGVLNYMIVDSQARKNGVDFKATSYGEQKKVLFERDLKVH